MHAGWCWEDLVPRLEAQGHDAHAIDLPGAMGVPTPAEVCLDDWRGAVIAALEGVRAPAVLVGHSMGGLAITLAAAERPDLIRSLVYLCAVVPDPAGASVEGPASQKMRDLFISADGGVTLAFAPDVAREIFYHECAVEQADRAMTRLRPQAARPLRELARFDPARLATLDVHYIRTANDRAIAPEIQQIYRARIPTAHEHLLACGHSPFFSHPLMLAELLDRIAGQTLESGP
jgi:pimeloyl-ACP methyl ester carboxylesterase